jgi:hypothetical protein
MAGLATRPHAHPAIVIDGKIVIFPPSSFPENLALDPGETILVDLVDDEGPLPGH